MESGGPIGPRTVLITGAGSGIGAAIALELATSGWRVALVGRREGPLIELATSLRGATGADVFVAPGDVRDPDRMTAIVDEVEDGFGPLDALVANAAIVDHARIAVGDSARWRDVLETNVLGVMHVVRAAVPAMVGRAAGHIILLASVSGRVVYLGEPAYVMSKHAVVAFGEMLRMELAPHGVRVTLVEPGLVDTPLVRAHGKAVGELLPGVVPLEAVDVARAVRFALDQPLRMSVNEIVIRPTGQIL